MEQVPEKFKKSKILQKPESPYFYQKVIFCQIHEMTCLIEAQKLFFVKNGSY